MKSDGGYRSHSYSPSRYLPSKNDGLEDEEPSSYHHFRRKQPREEENEEDDDDRDRIIIQALANRAFHLPGNTWCQDWVQYMGNNHPVFGLFCHHRLHPLTCGQRLLVLLGSIACGLSVSNVIYLYFLTTIGGIDGEFIALSINANVTIPNELGINRDIVLTNYQVALWTLGTTVHSLFDLSVWIVAACSCCQPGASLERCGGCKWIGSYIIWTIVAVLSAFASFVIVFRAALNGESEEDPIEIDELNSAGIFDDAIQLGGEGWESYNFLGTLGIELALSLFVYYFIVGTILFSGILGCCGRLPFIGGRPREVLLEQKKMDRVAKKQRRNKERRKKEMLKHERSINDGKRGKYSRGLQNNDDYLYPITTKRSNSSKSTIEENDSPFSSFNEEEIGQRRDLDLEWR